MPRGRSSRPIAREIGHGLPRGIRAHVDDAAAALDVRDADVAHGRERERIERGAVQQRVKILFRKGAEHAAARRVDEQRDLGLFFFKRRAVGLDPLPGGEVEREGAQRRAACFLQFLQPLGAPGDDPDLIKLEFLIDGIDELPSDAGGSSGDNCDLHGVNSPLCCGRNPGSGPRSSRCGRYRSRDPRP